ncbi:MAG: hypothetical protein SAMD01599839_11370 [Rectinema sp.]
MKKKPLSGISGSGAEESAQFKTTANDIYYVCLIFSKGDLDRRGQI